MTRVAALVGPTAVGKSAAALEIARSLGAEIVSVDSMQSYTGMDIGTDKPSSEMRAEVRHHMLDVWPPSHEPTVAEFQQRARSVIDDISRRGALPLLVGGSGLYFRAVVDELEFPPRSEDIRGALTQEIERVGVESLYQRLVEADPEAAARIEPGNARRVVRALEVIELTGRPFSENDAWKRYESIYELAVAGLERPRSELYERIDRRVTVMLSSGLVAEARSLAAAGMSRTAAQALGYRQVLECGDVSERSLHLAITRATKRFARRQESWFRADPRVHWFDATEPDATSAVAGWFRSSLGLTWKP